MPSTFFRAAFSVTFLSMTLLSGCGPEAASPAPPVQAQAAFAAEVDVVPAFVRPGTSVALQVYAVNETNADFTADVSLDIRTQAGAVVHERPWTALNFPAGKAWLLSSGFLTDARVGAAPYSASIRIRDSKNGALYFDDEVLSFGPGTDGENDGSET